MAHPLSDQLLGRPVPRLILDSSEGPVDLAGLAGGRLVLYVYPRTARPGEPLPPGWETIPGAVGCTAESCGYRDRSGEFTELPSRIAGLSAQALEDQVEFAERNGIPFPVIADPELRLAEALDLPTFEVAKARFYKRLTLVVEQGVIVKVFYPIDAPEKNAEEVLAWLAGGPA
jgi:peroxiredoxin